MAGKTTGAEASRKKRPYRSREERRAEIVDATLAILADEGMHAWTTSALAERVGCSEATLFKHFESKDEILTEALKRQAEALRRRVSDYEAEGTAWERTRGLVLDVLESVAESGGGPLVILLGHATRFHPEMGREVKETMGLLRARLEGFLAEYARDESDDGIDPSVLAQLVIAVAHSSALRWMVSDRTASPAAIARPLLRALERCTPGEEET